MFNHVVIPVADLEKSTAFYDSLLEILDIKRYEDRERARAYGSPECTFWLLSDPEYRVGSGHICFNANTKEAVDDFYKLAQALGGQGEGHPPAGYEAVNGFHYNALMSDLDGNKIEAVFVSHSPPSSAT